MSSANKDSFMFSFQKKKKRKSDNDHLKNWLENDFLDKHNIYMLKNNSRSIYNMDILETSNWREKYTYLLNNEV